ncbi:MAG: lipid-A-disaccharide synthase [Alphaproteobacteria bacterium]|nr:lipid-A-disaccharide synthase [Alphaproteobacteria bacterium]
MARDEPLIFLTAGEPSGDAIGARLMAALKTRTGGAVRFAGVGGQMMRAEGLESLFPMQELSVMGLLEVLPHARRLKRRIAETAAAVDRLRPDALVTIDSPGFSKRLEDRLGPGELPKIHYVAPTVWAWKPKRVHAFKARFDRLLCLLPFEPPYFEAVGLDAPFVGHPVLESGADAGDGAAFRARRAMAAEAPLLCVLPGSRRGEARRLLPVFGETVARLAAERPDLQVAIPSVDYLADEIAAATAGWAAPTTVLTGPAEKYDAMAASNAALAASGTVALELALARVPTVVAYRLNPITYWAINRMVSVDYVHLCNIMAEREIAPERLQDRCRPDVLAADVRRLMGAEGAAQAADLAPWLERLRPPQGLPSLAAADAVLELL